MFVQRPDASLFSLSFGHGPHTLFTVGGWIGAGEVWLDTFAHLPDWRCVTYDHRGCGVSRHQAARITVQDQVDDLLAVMDAQGVGRCLLGAESGGVGIALHAALQAPDRFWGLVLVGGSWKTEAPGARSTFIAQLRGNFKAATEAFVDTCLPEDPVGDWRRWGYHILARAAVEDAVQLLECRAELAVEKRVGAILCPVLLLHGDQDRIVPVAMSQELAAQLADAELHVLPGLGHVPMVTAPQQVAARIRQRFCSRGPNMAACQTLM